MDAKYEQFKKPQMVSAAFIAMLRYYFPQLGDSDLHAARGCIGSEVAEGIFLEFPLNGYHVVTGLHAAYGDG